MNRKLAITTLVLLSALSLPGALRAQGISNPDLFGKSLEAAAEGLSQYGRYDNPTELARVNRIGYELAQQTGFTKFPFTFGLIDMPVPNAMALPGGQVFVTRGMLDLGLDDDTLANVLGHEIGHVVHEHYLKMQHRATLMNVLGNLLTVGVMVGVDHGTNRNSNLPQAPYDPRIGYDYGGRGDLVQGAAAASLIVSELLLRNYSRDNEDESDREGQRWAAAAGYDPDGARKLWELMSKRAPQARQFGYWQTHPFADDREKAADIRKGSWKIETRKSADAYRQRTQEILSTYLDGKKPKEKEADLLKSNVLDAWPQGKSSETIRLDRLHRQRDDEMAKPQLSRDYGAVVAAYRKEADEVRRLDAKAPLLATLDTEVVDLEGKRKELYPKAVEVMNGGVYETAFLVAFLSNFPDAQEVPKVALSLGDAYSRLGNQTDAVTQYRAAWRAAPESPEGKRARMGLKNLAPTLKELAALQQLAEQKDDPELQKLSTERLVSVVKSYDTLENGAEYLRRFPEGTHATAVLERQSVLAENLYGEVVLYQGFGDAVKAITRINKILTHAPLSPAAAKLRERAIVPEPDAG
jgi:predicted Zn-dependent protease